jgi:phage gp16-like protein
MELVKYKAKGVSRIRGILLAKVHLAKKDLGLSDADYRLVLRTNFKVESAKDLSDTELDKLLRHFESKGWVPKDKNGNPQKPRKTNEFEIRPDVKPRADRERNMLFDKMEALLAEIGRLQGRRVPWAYAEAILQRQKGGKFLNWASYEALIRVVQALSYRVKKLEAEAQKAHV